MESEGKSVKKQNYEKPRLRVIELVAEEVLGFVCKRGPGAPGRNSGDCGNHTCRQSPFFGS